MLKQAMQTATQDDIIVVCGSFFLMEATLLALKEEGIEINL